ncbi:MAG TPA: pyruvate, phosphate dikinase [Acidimicrobiia bacterium]|nr:pyruvate, phosphate dikinase [Acidimicrobiia bacterium]
MTRIYAFDQDHGLPLSEMRKIIGSKAANIAAMANDLGLPVPPGFAISTATCLEFLSKGWPAGLDEEIREHVAHLEAILGRGFGDAANPLLVSVRSGAPVSMPGMMDTLLNLGLNESTAEGLAALSGDTAFVAACRQRLATSYRDVVGLPAPEDPWEQLRGAVEAVFRSWNGDRACSYRAREGIPDDLGTGVIVQAMVFGNWSDDSATGVLFTRNPATGENTLYGDVMFRAQGEDVVAGTHQTEPIAVLDTKMPAVGAELRGYADALERYYTDVCDIEFTIERGRLWMLQTRIGKRSPQAALRIAVEMAEDESFPLSRAEAVKRVAHLLADPPKATSERGAEAAAVTTGLPASPGLAFGEIALTPEAAIAVAETGRPVILVRAETSPDDVHGMARAAGILTATGGLASHAAVVARGWGIPAVVGAAAVQVGEGTVTIGGHTLAVGDMLTVDGSTGEVFLGAVGGEVTIVPEAATLLSWARELGIEILAPAAAEAAAPGAPAEGGGLTPQMVLRALLIKGFTTPEGLVPAFQTSEEEAGVVLERLAADGLAAIAGGMFKLTPDGTTAARGLIDVDRGQWGPANAEAALHAFLPLDHRMKAVVTGWQMREVDGQQTMNDHSNAAYDAAVLADLRALHADVAAWLGPLGAGLPRLTEYGARLDRAAAFVGDGDHRYIASPRVDSYHSIWFEFHEDLILLAGRTRADEVAAGRA